MPPYPCHRINNQISMCSNTTEEQLEYAETLTVIGSASCACLIVTTKPALNTISQIEIYRWQRQYWGPTCRTSRCVVIGRGRVSENSEDMNKTETVPTIQSEKESNRKHRWEIRTLKVFADGYDIWGTPIL